LQRGLSPLFTRQNVIYRGGYGGGRGYTPIYPHSEGRDDRGFVVLTPLPIRSSYK